MNRGPIDRPRSAWFAALVALFVGLGAQALLESIVPADFVHWPFSTANDAATVFRADPDSLWVSGIVIRFLSFAMAGLVAVFLLGRLTGRLLGMLLVVAVLATVFDQFPSPPNLSLSLSLSLATFWTLAAPVAVAAGAWFASAGRGEDNPAQE